MEELQSGTVQEDVTPEPAPMTVDEPTPVMEAVEPTAPPIEPAAPPKEEAPAVPMVEGGRCYETLMIVPIRYEGPAFEPLSAEIRKVYEAEGAANASIDVIGRRQFAYKVKKQAEGIYINIVFSALPAVIVTIERDLRHLESIMRFLTTVKE